MTSQTGPELVLLDHAWIRVDMEKAETLPLPNIPVLVVFSGHEPTFFSSTKVAVLRHILEATPDIRYPTYQPRWFSFNFRNDLLEEVPVPTHYCRLPKPASQKIKEPEHYADVSWTVADIQYVFDVSNSAAHKFLNGIEEDLEEAMLSVGWGIIQDRGRKTGLKCRDDAAIDYNCGEEPK